MPKNYHCRALTCITACLTALLFSLSNVAAAEVKLVLQPAKNGIEKRINKRLATSPTIINAIKFLNDTFITPTDITLAFGSYEKIWYEHHEIQIPYQFIQNIREGYNNTRIPHRFAERDEFTGNTLFHVIFHEMAHALIEQYRLPVIGREEDAADSLADVLLIYFFEAGDQIVISAADLFYINSVHEGRLTKEDYWADHSLDKQRYYARICHAYGSNPTEHASLKQRVQFTDERAKRCIRQYREVERSWLTLLKPALKNSQATQ
jgi:hypothetical protein